MRIPCAVTFTMAAVLSMLACKGKAKARDVVAEDARAPSIAVLVDGAEVSGLVVTAAMPRRTLRETLADRTPPHDQWKRVVAVGKGRRLDIATADYRGYDLMLYEDASSRPGLGLFRKASNAGDTPLQAVVNLERIEIQTASAAVAPAPEPRCEVMRGGETHAIAAAQLATLPAVPWRSDGKRQHESAWLLRDLLALSGPLPTSASVTIRNGAGAESVQMLVDGEPERVLIKANQHGSFHLKRLDASGKTVWRFKNATAISID